MKRMQRTRILGHRGFTLSETLVAISLSSLVAGVAIPVTGQLMSTYRLSNAVKQLSFEIGRTRMKAVGERKFTRLIIQGNGQYVRLVSSDGVNYNLDGPMMSLPQGVGVTIGVTGAPAFNRQGLSTAGSVVTLTNGQGQKTITMNVLGRVSIS